MLNKAFDRVFQVLIGVSGGLFFIATILSCINVVLRKGFNHPWSWMEEIGAIMLVMMVFLPLAYLEWGDRHLKVTLVYDLFPPKVKFWVDKLQQVVILGICLLIAYATWEIIQLNYESKNITATLAIPLWMPYMLVFIGFCSAALVKVLQLLQNSQAGGAGHDH